MTTPSCYIAQAQVLVAPGPTTSGGAMNAIDRERTLARFWAKVNKTETCWLWTASKKPKGYGEFSVDGSLVYAHRFAYEAVVGPIPAGLTLDHLCRVRHCVNPTHLEAVTNRENNLRGESQSAAHARKTRCPQGHEYAGENLIVYRGARQCRECRNRRKREQRALEHGRAA